MRGCFSEASQIHLHGQIGPRCTAELVGHLVGFPVTLGGFKVDGEGEEGLFRYSHQIGTFLFGLLAAGVQLPAVGVIGKGGDHFNELVAKDRRSVLQFTPVENAVGRTAAATKFCDP